MDSYIVVDLETTGLNPKKDKIIEIGALKIQNGKLVETFQMLVNPGRTLTEAVENITHITDEELAQASYIEHVLPEYMEFAEDYPLLGHSILFDYSFLKRAAVNQGYSYEREGVDTLAIARAYLPELESRRLTYLCSYFGIEHQAHRALEDARATYALFNLLKDRFYKEEDKLFSPKKLIYQVKKEGPATRSQKEQLLKLLSYHSLTPEYNIDKLTKSEASRYMDQIIFRHGRYPKEGKE
ncbi:MAG: 3'-5' exonuclease [Lachnospiraceae bacterium]|nr:3'-5' exonuclease [Lachnospiraceae bacterium]